MRPVRGGAPAVEQAGGGKDEGSRADRGHARTAPVRTPQRVEQRDRWRLHDVARSRHDDRIRAGQCPQSGVGDDLEAVVGGQRLSWPLGAHDDAIPVRAHLRETEHLQRQAELEGADAVIGQHRDDALRAFPAGFPRQTWHDPAWHDLHAIRHSCHWQDSVARFTFAPKEASMTFLIATCEFPDRADLAAGMWQRLAGEFEKSPVDLLVLPELAGVDSFWTSPTFNEAVWRQAAATHATLEEHLRPIAAKRIV